MGLRQRRAITANGDAGSVMRPHPHRARRPRSGWTLVELLIGTALLVGAASALLLGMHYAMLHVDHLSQFQVAMNAARGQLERLAATDFDTLATGAAFAAARSSGRLVCSGEDANCNGVLEGGEDANGNQVLDGARLAIQIKNPDGTAPTAASHLLDLHVAVCWQSVGRRIGEDRNCNGQLEAPEDTDGDGWIDSPAMVSTRLARSS